MPGEPELSGLSLSLTVPNEAEVLIDKTPVDIGDGRWVHYRFLAGNGVKVNDALPGRTSCAGTIDEHIDRPSSCRI